MSNYSQPQVYLPPPNSSFAIISLVMSILGWTFLPLPGSIVAVILGRLAKSEIRKSKGALGGEGRAAAGLTLGLLNLGIFVFISLGFFDFWLFILRLPER